MLLDGRPWRLGSKVPSASISPDGPPLPTGAIAPVCPRLNDATGLRTPAVVLPALITVPKAEAATGRGEGRANGPRRWSFP